MDFRDIYCFSDVEEALREYFGDDFSTEKKESKKPSSASEHKSVKEFKVDTIEVAGFVSAFKALRLPYGREERSVLQASIASSGNEVHTGTSSFLSDADIKLLNTLIKRGDEHAKVLRGINAYCTINAPRYFHQELDTYRVGAERLGSESTMHIQGQGLSEDALVEMKENLKEGTMQKRIWMFSYQTLRRIYHQRKDHRLPQWHKFCDWIETLPFAKEFIVAE